MFSNLFTGWHLLIVLAIVVLLFGAAKLPQLAKGVGQSIRIFRSEMKSAENAPKSEHVTTEASESVKPAEPVNKP
jgi:sec-independent protein translocase protein TatA